MLAILYSNASSDFELAVCVGWVRRSRNSTGGVDSRFILLGYALRANPTYMTIIQKHIDKIAEIGVMIYFSFLLLEIKFITVFNERYTAITIQIILVTLFENHRGINPPICKIMITKNICKMSCPNKISLNFFGKILYCPPIVNSPKGKPQIMRIDNVITANKILAPIIAATS